MEMMKKRNAESQSQNAVDFSGQVFHALDDKYRLVIPQQFRDGLGKEFMVVISSRDTLYLIPSNEWKKLQEQLTELMERDAAQYRAVVERMRAFSAAVKADRSWRVLIPKELRERAQLKKQIVSIGQRNRIEVMDKDVYEREVAPQLESEQTKRLQRSIGW